MKRILVGVVILAALVYGATPYLFHSKTTPSTSLPNAGDTQNNPPPGQPLFKLSGTNIVPMNPFFWTLGDGTTNGLFKTLTANNSSTLHGLSIASGTVLAIDGPAPLTLVGDGTTSTIGADLKVNGANVAVGSSTVLTDSGSGLHIAGNNPITVTEGTSTDAIVDVTNPGDLTFVFDAPNISSFLELYAASTTNFGPDLSSSTLAMLDSATVSYVGIGAGDGSSKYFALNTATGNSKTEGDIQISTSTKGLILTAPNGTCWRASVDNSGTIATASTTCQ